MKIINPIDSRRKLEELGKEIFNMAKLAIEMTEQTKRKFYDIATIDKNEKKKLLAQSLEKKIKTLSPEDQDKIKNKIKSFFSKL